MSFMETIPHPHAIKTSGLQGRHQCSSWNQFIQERIQEVPDT